MKNVRTPGWSTVSRIVFADGNHANLLSETSVHTFKFEMPEKTSIQTSLKLELWSSAVRKVRSVSGLAVESALVVWSSPLRSLSSSMWCINLCMCILTDKQ